MGRSPLVFAAGCLAALSGPGAAGQEADAPRVVAAWAAGPFEARVAWDRPLDEAAAGKAVGRSIEFDESRPTVHARPAAPGGSADTRGALRVAAARLDDGGRTLVLTTDPHPRAATYTVSLPVAPGRTIPVVYDLSGVEAAWDAGGENASPVWTGWWPTLDPAEARTRLANSPGHARGFDLLARPGRLTLTTLVTLPKGPAALQIAANAPVEATLGGEAPEDSEADARRGRATFRVESTGEPTLLTVTVPTGKALTVRVTTEPGGRGPDRLTVPWAPAAPPPPAPLENIPDLSGGDPRKGAVVFASGEAKCANCHKVRGQGGGVGPDLSALVGRDRTQVYRDIAEPSARIHPDYVPYTLALKDGRVLVGTVRADGADAVRVTDTEAKTVVIPRAEVDEFRPGATSIMPVGLAAAVGERNLRDLVAFLTTDTPPVPVAPPAK